VRLTSTLQCVLFQHINKPITQT